MVSLLVCYFPRSNAYDMLRESCIIELLSQRTLTTPDFPNYVDQESIEVAKIETIRGDGWNCQILRQEHTCEFSFIVVAMNSRDRYEIIRLWEISHFIKQPCRNVCLEKALEMHQSC